jgi:hypothetical protein
MGIRIAIYIMLLAFVGSTHRSLACVRYERSTAKHCCTQTKQVGVVKLCSNCEKSFPEKNNCDDNCGNSDCHCGHASISFALMPHYIIAFNEYFLTESPRRSPYVPHLIPSDFHFLWTLPKIG